MSMKEIDISKFDYFDIDVAEVDMGRGVVTLFMNTTELHLSESDLKVILKSLKNKANTKETKAETKAVTVLKNLHRSLHEIDDSWRFHDDICDIESALRGELSDDEYDRFNEESEYGCLPLNRCRPSS